MIGSLFKYKYLQICIYQRSLYSPHEFLKSLNIFPFVYDSCLPCNHIEKVDSFIRLSFAVPSSWALLRRQYISLILYKQRKRCVDLIFNMKLRMLRSFLRVWIIWITYVDLLIHDGQLMSPFYSYLRRPVFQCFLSFFYTNALIRLLKKCH